MRRLLVRLLTKADYRVTAHGNGLELLEGVEAMRARGALPDVIVSDLRMPGASGLDLLEKLEVLEVAVPVILVSAFCDEETLARATLLGAACVLSKPFDMDLLRSAVACVVAARRADDLASPSG